MMDLDIAIRSKKWLTEKNIEKKIKIICKKIISLTELKKFLQKDFFIEISISLVSNAQIKKTNFQFRGKNKPTDVLSFPSLDENLIRQIGLKKVIKSQKQLFLGDIVIAYEIVKKESLVQKKKFLDHLTHLILHSILHLVGHDHEETKMAEKMEKLEITILKKLKISNPYQH